MSTGIKRGEGDISNAYDINVLDALARNQKHNRDRMYEEALLNNQKYLQNRREAEEIFVDNMIKNIYEDFRSILSKGEIPKRGNVPSYQLKYPSTGAPYCPCVPAATLTKYAMKVAETMETICTEAMEEIYPKEHKDLALKKATDVSKLQDLSRNTVPATGIVNAPAVV